MTNEARLYQFLQSVERNTMLEDIGPNTKRMQEDYRLRYLTPRQRTPFEQDQRAGIFQLDDATAAMADALPVMHKIALLNMRESYVRRRVVSLLIAEHDIQDRPAHSDYTALLAQGLAYKRAPADRWHELTAEGRKIAAHIERELCKRYHVHQLGDASNAGRFHLRYSCSCGWSTTTEKGSTNPDASARRDHAQHAKRAREGHTDESDMAAAVAVFEKAIAREGA